MIEIKSLCKKYHENDKMALDHINFTLHEGEIVGLIGQNGAGKSTLLKSLCKFIRPTNGEILFDGKNIFRNDNYLENVGILLEPVVYPYLTAYENLEFYLNIHGKQSWKSEIDSMLTLVGLIENKDKYPGDFSFGMKQRLGLAQALLCDPKLLILDEPFVGLDPIGIKELIEILHQRVKEKKMQAIISSHQLYELTEICERVLVLHDGKLVYDGIPDYNPEITFVLDREYTNDIDDKFHIHAEKNQIVVTACETELHEIIGEIHKNYRIINIQSRKSVLEKFFEGVEE